jgi:hypothetical protein
VRGALAGPAGRPAGWLLLGAWWGTVQRSCGRPAPGCLPLHRLHLEPPTTLAAPWCLSAGPCSGAGSVVVAELAQLARPRYHIAAGHPVFYPRPPYVSKDLGAGGARGCCGPAPGCASRAAAAASLLPLGAAVPCRRRQGVRPGSRPSGSQSRGPTRATPLPAPAGKRATRFVGLAPVGNAAKQKFLHALGLAPATSMNPEQLSQEPEGSTPSPFEMAAKRPAQQEVRAPGAGGACARGVAWVRGWVGAGEGAGGCVRVVGDRGSWVAGETGASWPAWAARARLLVHCWCLHCLPGQDRRLHEHAGV